MPAYEYRTSGVGSSLSENFLNATLTQSSCEKSKSQRSAESRGFPPGTPVSSQQGKLTGWVRQKEPTVIGICCCGDPALVGKAKKKFKNSKPISVKISLVCSSKWIHEITYSLF